MKIWRCAGKRPFGSPCRRRVDRRARWNTTWRCWTGPLCDRCWRDALRYEPDRDAAIALDPNAPGWVLEHLSRSRDELVLANLAARGAGLDPAVRRRLVASGSSMVSEALDQPSAPTPAWSLYRSTPRPGVTVASIVSVGVAFGVVSLLESAHKPTAAPLASTPPSVPPAAATPSTTVATASVPWTVATPSITVVEQHELPPAPTLPVDQVAEGAPVEPSTTTTPATNAPSTTTTVAPPPIQAVQVPTHSEPAPSTTPAPTTVLAGAPSRSATRTLTFDVPFPATVAYVASYGIDEVVLQSPDGATFLGSTAAEGTGPAGTWTATVRTNGQWAGEFTSRG